jgi:hypothetical protein
MADGRRRTKRRRKGRLRIDQGRLGSRSYPVKLTPLLLAGSLAANAVLAVVAFKRTAPLPQPVSPLAPPVAASKTSAAPAAAAGPARAWPALGSTEIRATDFAALAARLRAEGFSPEVVRRVVTGIIASHFEERSHHTIRPRHDPLKYWVSPVVISNTSEESIARLRLEREQELMFREVFGDHLSPDRQAQHYHGLSPASVERLKKIFSDYQELEHTIRVEASPGDATNIGAKLALLAREKRADIERALTPAELYTYDLRNGPAADRLRNHLIGFTVTETEFLAAYPAVQAILAAEGNQPRMTRETRLAQQAKINEALRTAMGEQRFQEFVKSRRNP